MCACMHASCVCLHLCSYVLRACFSVGNTEQSSSTSRQATNTRGLASLFNWNPRSLVGCRHPFQKHPTAPRRQKKRTTKWTHNFVCLASTVTISTRWCSKEHFRLLVLERKRLPLMHLLIPRKYIMIYCPTSLNYVMLVGLN